MRSDAAPLVTLPAEEESSIRDYLLVLRQRRWTIAIATVIGLVGALGYSVIEHPVYQAEAQVLLPQQSALTQINTQYELLTPDPTRTLSDDVQFAEGKVVQTAVQKKIGFTPPITVTSSATADLITFSAKGSSGAKAAQGANTYAQTFIASLLAKNVASYADQVTSLESTITSLVAKASALDTNDPERAALTQSADSLTQTVQDLQAAAQLAGQEAPTITTPAATPSSPISPNPVRDGILGLLAGLIVGISLAFVRNFFDDSINSRRDLEQASGNSLLLGVIPVESEWTDGSQPYLALQVDPTSAAAEAYRTLRTAVQFVSVDPPIKVLSITSAVLGEGKTTTVANLAISFGRAGRRVVVVDYDLRRPRLHHFFGSSNDVGLTSVLRGEVSLREAMVAIEGEPNLVFMPSGPIPTDPAELLSLERNRTLVESLSARADLVLLDCPPVLPVSDALLTSHLADGIVLVASAGSTKKSGLQRACELLAQVDAPVIGVALNRVPIADSYQYNYGYYYSAEYSASSTGNGSNGSGRSHGSGRSSGSGRSNGSANGNRPSRVGQS